MDTQTDPHTHSHPMPKRRSLLGFFARLPEKTQVTLILVGYQLIEQFLRR